MAFDSQNRYQTAAVGRETGYMDEGLRAYMLRVYNYMTGGLALTGLVAYAFANVPALFNLMYSFNGVGYQPTILAYAAMFSPLIFILVLSFGINKLQPSTAQILYWVFAGVMGMSLSHIFLVYTGASITRVFFITSAMFAGMSLYGYTTKKDLSSWGSFLFMGLIGLIIASIVNIFMQSSMMSFIISAVGVLVFVGLTAYDTQQIKSWYNESDHGGVATKKAVYGALSLYLDFINLFLMLLRLMGSRE